MSANDQTTLAGDIFIIPLPAYWLNNHYDIQTFINKANEGLFL